MRRQEINLSLVRAGIRIAGRGQGFGKAARLLDGVSRLGKGGSVPVPPQLVPMGARVLAQGYLNRVALPMLSEWLLPRWMREQPDPDSPCFVPRSVHNLLVNQTARGWTALGLPGAQYPVESMVDRWGLLTPVPGGPSLDWWAHVDGSAEGRMCAGKQSAVVQRLQGGLPVVVTAFEAGGLRVSSEVWMLPLEGYTYAAMQVVLFNIADMPLTGTFSFALRPYNPEGIAPVYDIAYDGRTLRADGRIGPLTWPRPDSWRLSNLAGGDLLSAPVSTHPAQARSLHDPHGLAHGVLEYRFNIEPWEEAEFLAFMPVSRQSAAPENMPALFTVPEFANSASLEEKLPRPQGYSRAKAATTLEWRRLLDTGMQLALPDADLQESWEASRVHLLALHDGGEITPGPDLYHDYWLRDAAVMLYALSTHGYREAAQQLVLGMLSYQQPLGLFVSQASEWDGTGQVLWAACQHLALHPDPQLQATVRGPLLRGVRWLSRTLDKHGGLLPPGMSSEHFGPPDTYYWDDIWSLAGLEAAAALFEEGWITAVAQKLRAGLAKSFALNAHGDVLPGAPGRGQDLSAIGTLAAWFPLGVYPETDPYLAGTLDALGKLFYRGALFVNTGHSGWGTYLNMRLAGCYSLLGSPRGEELMDWLLRHASPTYNWPEAVHTRSGSGSTGDGHHGWASAEWLLLIRSLLLRETTNEIVLAPALPSRWLRQAGSVRISRAPTGAGQVGYTLGWDAGASCMRMEIEPKPTGSKPLIWALPQTGGSVIIDGRATAFVGGRLQIPPEARSVEYRQGNE